MKNTLNTIVILFCLLLVGITTVHAQPKAKKKTTKTGKSATAQQKTQNAPAPEKLSLDTPPAALPASDFEFPAYEEFTLPNGLHVYVIQNSEQPTITLSLMFKGGDAYDPAGKEGTAAMAGDMLNKGTKNHSAKEIAEKLDGVGAGLSVNVAGESMTITGSALKKHATLLFTILGEQLTAPLFDEEELGKLKQQFTASIAYEKSRPNEIAQALSRKVVYGFDNPLARKRVEASVQAITRKDVVDFHNTWVRPNNASIAIVGDVTVQEAKALISKHFKGWEKGVLPEITMPELKTEPAGVYFIPRKGAVQSMVIACAAAPAVKDPDFYAASVAASFIGSGFGSLLNATLRETYSYTYSPFGFCTRGKRYNRIAVGAEVRTSVTDSAINVILHEIKKLGSEGPNEDQFGRRVALEAGQFRTALERSTTVAAILQNAWMNEQALNVATSYATQIEQLASTDIQDATNKYLNMFKLRLVVVGSPEIKSKLEEFGPVYEYTTDLVPAKEQQFEKSDLSVEQIIEAYKNALGGQSAIAGLTTLTSTGKASLTMQGQKLEGVMERKVRMPNSEYQFLDFKMFQQSQWVDGSNAWVSMNNAPAAPATSDEKMRMLAEARLFPALSLVEDKYKLEVLGKKSGQYVVAAVAPWGRTERYYFDATSKLLVKIEKDETTPQGIISTIEKYENYSPVQGVQVPSLVKIQNSIYSISIEQKHVANTPIEDSTFKPAAGKN